MDPVPLQQQDPRRRLIGAAREWLKHNSRRGDHFDFGLSQWDIYLAEMAEGVLRLVLENGGDEDQLAEKLADAHSILWNIKATIKANPDRQSYQKLTDEQFEKLRERIHAVIWTHGDPQRALTDGYTSDKHLQFERGDLWHQIAKYLERPWLQSPALEWLLVDAMIYHELVQFADAIKLEMPGGGYFKAEGNLEKMNLIRIKWRLRVLAVKAAIFLGTPAVAVWWAFKQGNADAAFVSGAAYIALMIVWTIWERVRRLVWKPKKSQHETALELWGEMSNVYKLLNPPIINPTLVKEALIKTKEKGAVWDTAAYTLVERAIARDPHAWIADPWARADRLIEI